MKDVAAAAAEQGQDVTGAADVVVERSECKSGCLKRSKGYRVIAQYSSSSKDDNSRTEVRELCDLGEEEDDNQDSYVQAEGT